MKVYLIPCPLAENAYDTLSFAVHEVVKNTTHYLVEDERSARRFISGLGLGVNVRELNFYLLDKKTKYEQVQSYFKSIPSDANVGIISEAGCPGIADPGAKAVEYAHKNGIEVQPLIGPSSILLALMASGFNGQNFAFYGYLPVKKPEKVKEIKRLENDSMKFNRTQVFMETPYRNNALLDDLVANCHPDTKLCVACNITAEDQYIKTLRIAEWKKEKVDLHKKPTIFVLHAK
ncbi:SAM-dependent methyltransferase [Limibacter armeniacum]|uniref:SAM-dependent methyltransferase n=1 Tax=Limibacter armeniacum TaxID=466084 RepID=UPI002FE64A5E